MKLRPFARRTLPWSGALLLAAGTIIVATAGLSIASWHGVTLGNIAPSSRIQYDAAWAFAFAGASLVAGSARWNNMGRAFAAMPIALGALRLIAHFSPGALAVRPLLVNPWLPYGEGSYDDMGVLTALLFVVSGSALASLRQTPRGPWRSVWIALLASIAFALSLLLLVGAWSSSPAVSEWMTRGGGENVNALLFIVMASTLLAYGLLGSKDEKQALRRSTPVIVWLAVFACVLVLWRALTVEETRVIQHSTTLVATDARSQVERDLNTRTEMLERLAERTLIHPFNAEIWRRDVGALLKDFDELQTLAWADPDYIVRWVVPETSEARLLGYNLLSDPRHAATVRQAVQNKRATFGPFAELAPGSQGVVIYVPVFQGDELRGVVSGALGRGNWLKSLLNGRFADYAIELLEDGRVTQAVDADVPVASRDWTVELPRPASTFIARRRVCRRRRLRSARCWRHCSRCRRIFSRPPAGGRANSIAPTRACKAISRAATTSNRSCVKAKPEHSSSSTQSAIVRSTCSTWKAASRAGIRARRH